MRKRIMNNGGLTIRPVKAISDDWLLPFDKLPPSGENLYAQACRGQTVCLSFVVHSKYPCTIDIQPNNGCPECQPQVELKHVVPWFQDLNPSYGNKHDVGLVPELLANDPHLIELDNENKRNVLPDRFVDADHILPVAFAESEMRQYWVVVRIPCNTTPGQPHYSLLKVIRNGSPVDYIKVFIDVLPFELAPSDPYTFGCYHKLTCQPGDYDQFIAECENLADHGLTHNVFWQDMVVPWRETDQAKCERRKNTIKQMLQVRASCGLSNSPLIIGRASVPWINADNLETELARLNAMHAWLRDECGIGNVLVEGYDEADVETMQRMRPIYQAIQERTKLGIAAACSGRMADALNIIGQFLDVVKTNNPEADVALWPDSKVWLYGASAYELPDSMYRARYGASAYQHGFNGACIYAYSESWGPDGESTEPDADDTNSPRADHHLVLRQKGIPGVIETRQLWGLHEAWSDVRYLRTAEERCVLVPPATGDLDDWRAHVAGLIMETM